MLRCLGLACLMLLPLPGLALAADPPATSILQGAAPQAGANSCGGTGPVVLRPIAATHIQPPYPPESQRLSEQGVTTMRVEIGPDGAVTSDTLVTSSGSARLDQAALDFVKQNYRWAPTNCVRPVATLLRIAWMMQSLAVKSLDPVLVPQLMHFLNADPADYSKGAPQIPRMTLTIVVLKQDGSVGQVAVARSSGDPEMDLKCETIIRAHRWQAAQMDGKPQAGILYVGVLWTPPGQKPIDPGDVTRVMQLFAPPPLPAPPP